jgi:hypothetical protein
MARAFTVLFFAVIGTALALLDHFYLAGPQTASRAVVLTSVRNITRPAASTCQWTLWAPCPTPECFSLA